jgi:branched-chain amino acid aminotransferase
LSKAPVGDTAVHRGALEGITRGAVMELAPTVGLVPEERLFTPFDLYTADEVFLTGTAAEVIPVVQIDARPIGEGNPVPRRKRLIEAFHNSPNGTESRSKGTYCFWGVR